MAPKGFFLAAVGARDERARKNKKRVLVSLRRISKRNFVAAGAKRTATKQQLTSSGGIGLDGY